MDSLPTLASPQERLSTPDPRDKKKYYLTDTPQRRALIVFARSLFVPLMKMEVQGVENLPRDGAVILAANHVTNFDVFPMQFALPRVVFFMGKAELFRNPILDMLVRNLSGFPVNRGEKDPWAMNHALKVLRQGQVLGMFPEGRRSKGRGLGVANTGTARLAIEAGCPILPMTVLGSDRFFKSFPQRTRVLVTLLPPLQPKRDENPLAFTDRLMFTLAQALPEDLRGVYAAAPRGFGG
jgi:1-acyl-sn-glycerol-3-phosphate acyltransferase